MNTMQPKIKSHYSYCKWDESLVFPAKKPKHLSWFRLSTRFYAHSGARICMPLPIRCLPSCARTLNSMSGDFGDPGMRSDGAVHGRRRKMSNVDVEAGASRKPAGGRWGWRTLSIKEVHSSPVFRVKVSFEGEGSLDSERSGQTIKMT